MKHDLELTARTYRKLPCIQNAGHYGGEFYPRIVRWNGGLYTLVDDRGAPIKLRHFRLSDLAPGIGQLVA